MKNQQIYLTEAQVADMTGIAVSTLRNQRFERRGIPYVKLSRSVRYSRQDVFDYMNAHRIDISAERDMVVADER